MRIVVQRGREASVTVDGEVVGALPRPGLVVFVGITHTDTAAQADWLAGKCWDLRVLPDEKSASDLDAPILAISNFTLYANARKGRRPAWNDAAPGPVAEPLFDEFVAALRRRGAHVETGRFGAMMDVAMVNDGPLTLVLDADADA